MAYARKRATTRRSTSRRSSPRRSGYGRRTVSTARRRASPARGRGAGNTVRIVIEQPGQSLARPEIGVTQAAAPRRRAF